ncbi:melanopsin-like [Stegodyphus dumicola]|uniref:melanopsin-like n=1 Tax=Stegodyphus dumicola TaxID=202533 RepID=UPI0015B03B3E|nr:melanopsin-like [Stegodyphus dumicola]
MDDDDLSGSSLWTEDVTFISNATTLLVISSSPASLTSSSPTPQEVSSTNDIIRYIQFSSLILVTAMGFISNVLVLLLFYKRPTLRSFSNRFVLNLSISHFWYCVLVLPIIVISTVTDKWLFGDTVCIISGFLFTTLNITSVLSLLLIAVDRNCAVNSPLHYSMTITKQRTGILIFSTWLLGVIVASPPFFGITDIKYRPNWHMCTLHWKTNEIYSVTYGSVLVVVGFMVPFLTTICVYSSMFQAARDNSERARKHSVNSTIVETNIPDSQAKMATITQKRKCRRWSSGSNQFFGEEWKAVRTGLLVVMTFTLCWLPYFTVTSMEAYFDVDNVLPNYVLFFAVLCASSASVINPYLYVFRNKTSRKHVKQIISYSNLSKNKRWIFHRESKDKSNQTSVNPCILAASLVNESSEKVKALPALYQDIDGHWQVFSTSEERSREELDETVSNISDEDFFDSGMQNISIQPCRKKNYQSNSINVQAIYNNSYNRPSFLKNMSQFAQPNSTNRLLLFRLKPSLNRDSTSSDTTDNCSMSLESNNSNEHQLDPDFFIPSRRGIGKYLFNTSEELWESKPAVTYHKRISSVAEESTSSSEGRKTLSSFGSARRKSFIHSHIKNKKSSETTLTSSTNSETIESSSAASVNKTTRSNRPKLIRQPDTIIPPDDYGES